MPPRGSVLPDKATRGCRNCRNRRVLCDGARPCQKCVKKGIDCDAVRPSLNIRFRHETTSTLSRRAFWIPAPHACALGSPLQAPHAPPVPTTSTSAPPLVPRPLRSSSTEYAEHIFFTAPKGIMAGALADPWIRYNWISQRDIQKHSYLSSAIETVTMSAMASSLRRRDLHAVAARASAKCAQQLRTALASWQPGAAAEDLLFAVLLLIVNQFIAYQHSPAPLEPEIRVHVKGALAIAAHAFDHSRLTQRQKHLMSTLRLDAGWDCMIAGLPLPPFMSLHPPATARPHLRPEERLESLYMRGVSLRAASRSAHATPSADSGKRLLISKLVAEAQLMSADLGEWMAEFAAVHDIHAVGASYHLAPATSIRDMEIFPGIVVLGSSCDMTAYFHYGKAQQLHIFALSIVIRGLCWDKINLHQVPLAAPALGCHHDQLAESIHLLHDTVNVLCGMLPFVLGLQRPAMLPPEIAHLQTLALDGGAPLSLVAWANILLTIEGLPRLQREWVVGRMQYVGNVMGVRIATFFSYQPSSLIFPDSSLEVDSKCGATARDYGLFALL